MPLDRLALLFLLVSACSARRGPSMDGKAQITGKGRLSLEVNPRVPIQCSSLEKDETLASVQVAAPTGCSGALRYRLAPTGQVDVDLPYHRGARPEAVGRRVDAEKVVSGEVILRDPEGRSRWEVAIPLDRMPWTGSGRCAGPAPADAPRFDFNAWRFLLVQVRSRDAYGRLNPYVAGRDASITVDLTTDTGATIEPVVVASTSTNGLWAAVWCDDRPVPRELRFGVRGAYQLETDAFRLPDITSDTYTLIQYVVEPTKRP